MIEALSYLNCHGNICTIGTYAINQGLTISLAMAFIIIITIIGRFTIVKLHKFLCTNFKNYENISNILLMLIGVYFIVLIFK